MQNPTSHTNLLHFLKILLNNILHKNAHKNTTNFPKLMVYMSILAKPNNYLADVTSPASLLTHRVRGYNEIYHF